MTKAPEVELLEAIRKTLGDLEFEGSKVNFYMGRTKSVSFPYCNIYLGDVPTLEHTAKRWEQLNPFCVIEFTYAADAISDTKLYTMGAEIRNKLSNGILYTRGGKDYILTPLDMEKRLQDGFFQLTFNLEYSIDTQEKINQDNTDLMETLDFSIITGE